MITVIMASYNGARTLPMVLDAYQALETPLGGWKVVIVDNVSDDQTKTIIESYADSLPLTYLYEAKRGKNAALNRALTEIEGEIVVFTDDDAIPESSWLQDIVEVTNQFPEYSIFGGRILPRWETTPPEWLISKTPLGVTFALTADSISDGEIHPGLIWGPNMTVRSQVFADGNRFDETIGPNRANYAMGSETEFNIRMAGLGYRCCFSKKPTVFHFIRSFQLDPIWVLGRARRFGRGKYRQDYTAGEWATPMMLGVPRWMFATLVRDFVRTLTARLTGRLDSVFSVRWDIAFTLGYIQEARNRRRTEGEF